MSELFFTEVGKVYRVTGADIDAHHDYTPPADPASQDRGTSTNPAFALNQGDLITVTQHVRRVENGVVAGSNTTAPYEVVKATVRKDPPDDTQYYVWVVYAGTVKVQLHETTADNKDTDDEPPVDEPRAGDEIEVRAGQTLVLELKADGTLPDTGETHDIEGGKGFFKLEIKEEETGKPLKEGILYLIDEHNSIRIFPVRNGICKGGDLPAGDYRMSLQVEMAFFESDKSTMTQEGIEVVNNMADFVCDPGQEEITELICVGFTENVGSKVANDELCLKRAIECRKYFLELLGERRRINVKASIGGTLKANGEESRKLNNRVDFLLA